MKKILLCCIFIFVSCDFRTPIEKKADQDASDTYNQVCELIESGNVFNNHWKAIKDNYRQGKKILFLAINNKVSIVVVRNTENSVIPDSTRPVDTGTIAAPALNSLDEAMKKTQNIANKLSGDTGK